jgi:hypothetical protein
MSDNVLKRQFCSADAAGENPDFDLVTGVFTSNAALLVSRSHFLSRPIGSGEEGLINEEAFYIYYHDKHLQWMYVIDYSGVVRQLLTCCKTSRLAGCCTDLAAVSYQQAC